MFAPLPQSKPGDAAAEDQNMPLDVVDSGWLWWETSSWRFQEGIRVKITLKGCFWHGTVSEDNDGMKEDSAEATASWSHLPKGLVSTRY